MRRRGFISRIIFLSLIIAIISNFPQNIAYVQVPAEDQFKKPSVVLTTNKTVLNRGETLKLNAGTRAGTDPKLNVAKFRLSFRFPDGRRVLLGEWEPMAIPDKVIKGFLEIPFPIGAVLPGTSIPLLANEPGQEPYRIIAELLAPDTNEIIDASTVSLILSDNPSGELFTDKTEYNLGDEIKIGVRLSRGKINNIVEAQIFVDFETIRGYFTGTEWTLTPKTIGPVELPDLQVDNATTVKITQEFPNGLYTLGSKLLVASEVINQASNTFTIGKGTVGGRVITTAKDNLSGYEVMALTPDGKIWDRATTDSEGKYQLKELPFGKNVNYVLVAQKGDILLSKAIPNLASDLKDQNLDASSTTITQLVAATILEVLGKVGGKDSSLLITMMLDTDLPEPGFSFDLSSLVSSLEATLTNPNSPVSLLKNEIQKAIDELVASPSPARVELGQGLGPKLSAGKYRPLQAISNRIAEIMAREDIRPAIGMTRAINDASTASLVAEFSPPDVRQDIREASKAVIDAVTNITSARQAEVLEKTTGSITRTIETLNTALTSDTPGVIQGATDLIRANTSSAQGAKDAIVRQDTVALLAAEDSTGVISSLGEQMRTAVEERKEELAWNLARVAGNIRDTAEVARGVGAGMEREAEVLRNVNATITNTVQTMTTAFDSGIRNAIDAAMGLIDASTNVVGATRVAVVSRDATSLTAVENTTLGLTDIGSSLNQAATDRSEELVNTMVDTVTNIQNISSGVSEAVGTQRAGEVLDIVSGLRQTAGDIAQISCLIWWKNIGCVPN